MCIFFVFLSRIMVPVVLCVVPPRVHAVHDAGAWSPGSSRQHRDPEPVDKRNGSGHNTEGYAVRCIKPQTIPFAVGHCLALSTASIPATRPVQRTHRSSARIWEDLTAIAVRSNPPNPSTHSSSKQQAKRAAGGPGRRAAGGGCGCGRSGLSPTLHEEGEGRTGTCTREGGGKGEHLATYTGAARQHRVGRKLDRARIASTRGGLCADDGIVRGPFTVEGPLGRAWHAEEGNAGSPAHDLRWLP